MKRYSLPLFLMLVTLVVTGCTYDPAFEGLEEVSVDYRGDPVDAFLDITVGELSVSMETRAEDEGDPYEDTEAERWVNDIWVFQYDATDKKAIADPIFISISDKGYDQEILKNLPVTLSDNEGKETLIYVVANAGSDETWGSNFESETLLLNATLHTREPVMVTAETQNGDLSIPMEGNSEAVQVVANTVVRVPVTRMYAKIMIDPVLELQNSEIYSVGVGSIPLYCQVGSLYSGNDATAAIYPSDVQWISRTFTESLGDESQIGPGIDLGYRYIVYVPENLQGQAGDGNTSKLDQTSFVPARALQVNIVIKYTDAEGGTIEYPYTFYPGANTTDDYNIKRNNIYRVKANIYTVSIARVPSANCLFAFAGETITFFPYYRVETGGGYVFTDYLEPGGVTVANGTDGAKIDHVGIVWQTEGCIGDNSDGSLVYFTNAQGARTNSEYSQDGYERIYVKTQKEGNALIAAYDTEDNIIWSWHIWVRDPQYPDPTNIANADIYYTYQWDNTKIYSYAVDPTVERIAGYEIMNCNLGALQDLPNYEKNSNFGYHETVQTFEDGDGIVRTFGMMYQWGRKDPFPPLTTTSGAFRGRSASAVQGYTDALNTGYYIHDYNDAHTEQLYGNDNSTPVHKTSYDENGPTYSGAATYNSYLFHSHICEASEGIRYSIANPTVFLCGLGRIAGCLTDSYENTCADLTDYANNLNNYVYTGAWSNEDHDNKECGGSDPDNSGKKLGLGFYDVAGEEITLYDDYGTAKSIFDPCPYGWRVSSGDLWLGFAMNGVNALYDYTKQRDANGNEAGSSDGSRANINYDQYERSCLLGSTMYLGEPSNTWRTGATSWFPCQGFLLPDGSGYRVGGCGNYVNANVDGVSYDRVYITHIHSAATSFRIFEHQLHYTVKSTGNPILLVQ